MDRMASRVQAAVGYLHGTAGAMAARLRSQAGQGTVEYVALILLVREVRKGLRQFSFPSVRPLLLR